MAGSIATYSVDNQVLKVPPENYAEFAATIIPRGQTAEATVKGPPVSALRDAGGTVFVSLDEVVTDVDAAGRPTKTSNFEWHLSYSMNQVEKSDTVRKTPMTESRAVR